MSAPQNQALGAYAHGARVTASPVHGGLIPPHGGVLIPKHGEIYLPVSYGPELVTNGDAGSLTGWVDMGSTTTLVGGRFRVASNGGAFDNLNFLSFAVLSIG